MLVRHLSVIAVAVTLALGGLAASPGPVHAAGCFHDYCNGADPVAMGCAGDAATIASYSDSFQTVETRYSATCGAAWARTTIGWGNSINNNETTLIGWCSGCISLREDFQLDSRQVYSNMISITYFVQACGVPGSSPAPCDDVRGGGTGPH